MKNSFAFNKICGVESPHPFLEKVGVWLLGIFFLEYRTNKATLFARRNDCYALLAVNKANYIVNRLFHAPVVTQFIVKV